MRHVLSISRESFPIKWDKALLKGFVVPSGGEDYRRHPIPNKKTFFASRPLHHLVDQIGVCVGKA